MSSSIACRALLVMFSTATIAMSAAAQSPTSRHVTVALVQQLPDSAVATIVRSPGADGATTIMLRESRSDATTLGAAMRALFRSRHRDGDTLRFQRVIRLYLHGRAGSLAPNEQRFAAHYFAQLRAARPTSLAGVGPARVIQLALGPVGDGSRIAK